MALPSVPASARSNTARLTLRAFGAVAARQNEDDRRCGRRLVSVAPNLRQREAVLPRSLG
jgi:hypothetical protein